MTCECVVGYKRKKVGQPQVEKKRSREWSSRTVEHSRKQRVKTADNREQKTAKKVKGKTAAKSQ